jgi:hypothetical protein
MTTRTVHAPIDFFDAAYDDPKQPNALKIRRGTVGFDGMTRVEEHTLFLDEIGNDREMMFKPDGAKQSFEYKNYRDRKDMQEFPDGPERLSQAALAYMEDEINSRNEPKVVEALNARAQAISRGGSVARMMSDTSMFQSANVALTVSTGKSVFALDKGGVLVELPHEKEVREQGQKVMKNTLKELQAVNPELVAEHSMTDTAHKGLQQATQVATLEKNAPLVQRGFRDTVSVDHGLDRGR